MIQHGFPELFEDLLIFPRVRPMGVEGGVGLIEPEVLAEALHEHGDVLRLVRRLENLGPHFSF